MKTFFYQPTQVLYRMVGNAGIGIAFHNHLIMENGMACVIRYEVEELEEIPWISLRQLSIKKEN